MLKITFLGGAKKSFPVGTIILEIEDITIEDLLESLVEKKPSNTVELDLNNIIIAVNGTDSSAMQGKSTLLKNGDEISIIPIIHGGNSKIDFSINNSHIELIKIEKGKNLDIDFLNEIRKKFSNLNIQAISSNYILSKSHAMKIIKISFESKKNESLLTKKLETDILLRFANTTQISQAIKTTGLSKKNDFYIIAIGAKNPLKKLNFELKKYVSPSFQENNQQFLKNHFKISSKQMNATFSNSPLEDLIVEKAAILI